MSGLAFRALTLIILHPIMIHSDLIRDSLAIPLLLTKLFAFRCNSACRVIIEGVLAAADTISPIDDRLQPVGSREN